MKINRENKERDVLFGLIDLYIDHGKPIGSNTLKESGFDHLSSATIRNYFASLETQGLLKQHHSSGGRIPTDIGYRIYAENKLLNVEINKDDNIFLSSLLLKESKEISTYLQEAVEAISELTGCSTFIASPRFDQDFIIKIKLMAIDEKRIICIVLTDFGLVHTEILYLPKKSSDFSIKKIEEYFHFRLTGICRPTLSEEEELFARQYYNEIVLRHFVKYTNMQFEDVYRGGFSNLLTHQEFHDPATLSNALTLFENKESIKFILKESFNADQLKYWIGDDLSTYMQPPYTSTVIAIPYRIHKQTVGAIAILGPTRIAYKQIFGILKKASDYISENITNAMYKFKLNYRQPTSKTINVKDEVYDAIGLSCNPLIEKRNE